MALPRSECAGTSKRAIQCSGASWDMAQLGTNADIVGLCVPIGLIFAHKLYRTKIYWIPGFEAKGYNRSRVRRKLVQKSGHFDHQSFLSLDISMRSYGTQVKTGYSDTSGF